VTAGKPTTTKIGNLGEQVVARWLADRQWQIQAQHWRSRWGELDLVALEPDSETLVFVEVKTRSRRSWDAGGLLAVTPQKQERLWLTAELFLAAEPRHSQRSCRFDVALVLYRPDRRTTGCPDLPPVLWQEPLLWAGYEWMVADYLTAAFSQ